MRYIQLGCTQVVRNVSLIQAVLCAVVFDIGSSSIVRAEPFDDPVEVEMRVLQLWGNEHDSLMPFQCRGRMVRGMGPNLGELRSEDFWQLVATMDQALSVSRGVDDFVAALLDELGVSVGPVSPLHYAWSPDCVREDSYFTQLSLPDLRVETSVDNSQVSIFHAGDVSTYLMPRLDFSYVPALPPNFRFNEVTAAETGGLWRLISKDSSGASLAFLVSPQDGSIQDLTARAADGRRMRQHRQECFVEGDVGLPFPRRTWKVDYTADGGGISAFQLIVLDQFEHLPLIEPATFLVSAKSGTAVADFRVDRAHPTVSTLTHDTVDVVGSASTVPSALDDVPSASPPMVTLFWMCGAILGLVAATVGYFWTHRK